VVVKIINNKTSYICYTSYSGPVYINFCPLYIICQWLIYAVNCWCHTTVNWYKHKLYYYYNCFSHIWGNIGIPSYIDFFVCQTGQIFIVQCVQIELRLHFSGFIDVGGGYSTVNNDVFSSDQWRPIIVSQYTQIIIICAFIEIFLKILSHPVFLKLYFIYTYLNNWTDNCEHSTIGKGLSGAHPLFQLFVSVSSYNALSRWLVKNIIN